MPAELGTLDNLFSLEKTVERERGEGSRKKSRRRCSSLVTTDTRYANYRNIIASAGIRFPLSNVPHS